jgi:hypothetical protein
MKATGPWSAIRRAPQSCILEWIWLDDKGFPIAKPPVLVARE